MKFFKHLAADIALFMFLSSAVFAQHYTQVNLDSNVTGAAETTDPQLINAWGLARSSGSTWWVSDEATGFATLYNGAGAKQSLVVTIPKSNPSDPTFPTGTPTGMISNGSATDFLLAPNKPAAFIFATLDGTIAAWNPTIGVAPGCQSSLHQRGNRRTHQRRLRLYRPHYRVHRRRPLPLRSELSQGTHRCLRQCI